MAHHLSSDERGRLREVLVLDGASGDDDRTVGKLLPGAADDEVSWPRRPDGAVARSPYGGVVVGPLKHLVAVEHTVVLSNSAGQVIGGRLVWLIGWLNRLTI